MIEKKMLCIFISMLIAVGPHLITTFSMMHTYAGLSLLMIIIAYGIDNCQQSIKHITTAFILFLTASLTIDAHLIHESIKSGLVGKKMAQEAIRKTGKPIKSAYIIIIEDDYPKLSSFCVIPSEAFGWGIAAQYETNYQWPEEIEDTTIERSQDYKYKAEILGNLQLQEKKFDAVWIVDHNKVKVMR